MDDDRLVPLRVAPEPRLRAIPDEEAVELAKTAFHTARRTQLDLLAGSFNKMLFAPDTVTYRRLRGLQHEARKQVERAQAVERLIGEAVEAFEATRPVGGRS